ncbi:MAG: orotate phosphoribosyltransferase [Myxococcota bacterium]
MVLALPSTLSSVEVARQRLFLLLRERSFERRLVRLSSGRESHFYMDVKQTALHAEGSLLIGMLFYDALSRGVPVQAVGGLTLGADPLVTATSLVSSLGEKPLDAFIVRKEPKSHGTEQWIEGVKRLPTGAAVAVLEDVATTGASALKAIDRIEAAGFRVQRVLTVVDRQEGASEALEARGFNLESLFTRSDFLPAD